MKTTLIGVSVILVVIATGWWYVTQVSSTSLPTESDTPVLQTSTEAVTSLTSPSPTALSVEGGSTGGDAVHPLALTSFAERSFVGQNFRVGEVLARTDAYTRYFITYQSGELTISGIMNVPTGSGPFPVLFLNHGYIDPAIYTNGRGLRREQDYLAREGYVVIHSDYRNHAASDKDPDTDVHFRQGYAEDVINGIKAVQSAGLPYIDAARIGLLGHSMGGGVAEVIMVTQPELVDAIVLFAPVSADARDNFDKWIRSRPETAAKIIAEHGEPASNPSFWDSISPITFLDRVQVPIMIHHGTSDESVPLAWSQRLANALTVASKNITLHVYPGEPHEFAAAWPTVMARTTAFFDEHVKQ